MTTDQIALLKQASLNECITDDGDDILRLSELGYVDLWDMHPDGRRRWAITREGREALHRSV